MVIWLTGLPGSGKTALANRLYEYLAGTGAKVERMDGDALRQRFPGTGFSKEERIRHILRAGELAAGLEKEDKIVVVSLISPYTEARNAVRSLCAEFVEVFVKASIETCERRDPKGLYRKARSGEIRNFTGIDDPYEEPTSADCIVPTDDLTLEESFEILKGWVDERLKSK